MSLFEKSHEGIRGVMQDALLLLAFAMQDTGTWLNRTGARFEDWICPPKWLHKQHED